MLAQQVDRPPEVGADPPGAAKQTGVLHGPSADVDGLIQLADPSEDRSEAHGVDRVVTRGAAQSAAARAARAARSATCGRPSAIAVRVSWEERSARLQKSSPSGSSPRRPRSSWRRASATAADAPTASWTCARPTASRAASSESSTGDALAPATVRAACASCAASRPRPVVVACSDIDARAVMRASGSVAMSAR